MLYTESYFTFKGVQSREYDILVEEQPDIIIPPRRVEQVTVPGRSGTLFVPEDAYDSYAKNVGCALLSMDYYDKIAGWLTGEGPLLFSSEPDKVYHAAANSLVSFRRIPVALPWRRFSVVFMVEPLKRSVHEENHRLVYTSAATFFGQGSVTARPIITLTGSGNMTLTVNGSTATFTGVSGSITVNSQILDVYRGQTNLNSSMTGAFPLLDPGENRISWTGNVTRVEIEPCWRWT